MAVVAGLMFFVFRALFALMPAFSSRHPIKNWVTGVLARAALYQIGPIYRHFREAEFRPVLPCFALCYRVG